MKTTIYTDRQARWVLTIAGFVFIAFAIFLLVRIPHSEFETSTAVLIVAIALGGIFSIGLAKFGSRKAVQEGANAI